MEFTEHSELGWCSHTQAWRMRQGGMGEEAETKGQRAPWPQGSRWEGQGMTQICPSPATTF